VCGVSHVLSFLPLECIFPHSTLSGFLQDGEDRHEGTFPKVSSPLFRKTFVYSPDLQSGSHPVSPNATVQKRRGRGSSSDTNGSASRWSGRACPPRPGPSSPTHYVSLSQALHFGQNVKIFTRAHEWRVLLFWPHMTKIQVGLRTTIFLLTLRMAVPEKIPQINRDFLAFTIPPHRQTNQCFRWGL